MLDSTGFCSMFDETNGEELCSSVILQRAAMM